MNLLSVEDCLKLSYNSTTGLKDSVWKGYTVYIKSDISQASPGKKGSKPFMNII